MDQTTNAQLCGRCRVGLWFPGLLRWPTVASQANAARLTLGDDPFNICRLNVFQADFTLHDTLPDLPNLAAGIAEGCVFCSFLQSVILAENATWHGLFHAVGVGLSYYWDYPYVRNQGGRVVKRWILEASLLFQSSTLANVSSVYERDGLAISSGVPANYGWPLAQKDDGLTSRVLRMPAGVSGYSLSEQALEFLQSNIDRCITSCKHSLIGSTRFCPARLIDVQQTPLKIIETDPTTRHVLGNDNCYATLSYCWGNREEGLSQLQLTEHSLSRLTTSGFELEDMSPVQRDAVAVTQALGIPFLWIDALCIKQNDTADWERESSQMHEIFGHSHLTICNMRTKSCQHGFLSIENNCSVELPFYTDEPERQESYRVGPGFISHHAVRRLKPGSWGSIEFTHSQWSKRAWTFQEGIMSTRMILFGTSGVYFSCSKGLVWEYGGALEKPIHFPPPVPSSLIDHDAKEELYRRWESSVAKQYSGRQATYLEDSFAALSGVAQVFAASLRDEYLAGLWQGDLLRGLFWRLSSVHDSLDSLLSAFNGPYIAPSWSWVGRGSHSGTLQVAHFEPGNPLSFANFREKYTLRRECRELRGETTPTGLDRFGKISAATLSITAMVYPLKSGCCHAPGDQSLKRLSVFGDYCISGELGSKLGFGYTFDFLPPSREDESWVQELSLVYLGHVSRINPHLSGAWRTSPCGLIVHPANAEGEYWRVGTFGASTELGPGVNQHLLGSLPLGAYEPLMIIDWIYGTIGELKPPSPGWREFFRSAETAYISGYWTINV